MLLPMLLPMLILLAALVYRTFSPIFGGIPNFSPLMAIALCAGAFLPRRAALLIGLAGLFLSDLILNAFYKAPLFDPVLLLHYFCYLIAWWLGTQVPSRQLSRLLPASLAGSILFYLFTNSACWWTEPGYAKNLSGWMQSLTVGLPGFPPTWMFFRNSILSDLAFTLLIWSSAAAFSFNPLQKSAHSTAS